MKSEILVKAEAKLTQDVINKDLKTSDKNLGEILNEITSKHQPSGVYGSSR